MGTTCEELAYAAPDGTEYTAAELLDMDTREREALARSVLDDAIDGTQYMYVVQFIHEFEVEHDTQIGDGYDLFDIDELDGLTADRMAEFVDDVIDAAECGRINGRAFLHYDWNGDLYMEDDEELYDRVKDDRGEFVDELVERCLDEETMSFDFGRVDVPDDVRHATDDLEGAFSEAADE